MVWPSRARSSVATTEDTVSGTSIGQLQWPGGEPEQPARGDLPTAGAADAVHRIRRGRVGFGAAQLRHQVGAGHPVHAGVVHLGHHRQAAVAVAIGARHAFDDPHLPQRPAAVQRQRRDMAADLREFGPAARRRQPDAMQMAVDLEVVVIHPDRMVEVQRTVGELFAELRHRLDAERQRVAQPVEGVAARHRRRVQLHDRANMHGLRRRFPGTGSWRRVR